MKPISVAATLILFTIFSSCRFFNFTSEPKWDNLTSFKMYAFNYAKPLNELKDSEMDTLVSIDIPLEEAKKIFKDRVKPTYSFSLYKTMILCRLTFKDAPDRRFIISSYGAFFTDLYADRLYKVKPEFHEEWRSFVSGYERMLLDKNYRKHFPNEDTTQWYRGD
ncbi:hypothetical protein [uncultured Chitinophaga sp.]|jgi:hypothetical protein|uniref:hypothetical protein n=1 Tax=uncultured Chitinophaga sp. TaxID=339340 RepID=UPI0026230E7F|nr:hypothetical protein [uncultured Chitinophaga sp.]